MIRSSYLVFMVGVITTLSSGCHYSRPSLVLGAEPAAYINDHGSLIWLAMSRASTSSLHLIKVTPGGALEVYDFRHQKCRGTMARQLSSEEFMQVKIQVDEFRKDPVAQKEHALFTSSGSRIYDFGMADNNGNVMIATRTALLKSVSDIELAELHQDYPDADVFGLVEDRERLRILYYILVQLARDSAWEFVNVPGGPPRMWMSDPPLTSPVPPENSSEAD